MPNDPSQETIPAPKSERAADATTYVVLATDESDFWRVVVKVEARSGEDAIRRHVAGKTEGGVFVAVPARSWKPVKVTPKVETTLVIEEA